MNCLICGCDEKEVLTKLCSNMNIMGPFFKEKSSYVVACPKCGHVYVDIDADQEAFTEYYASEYSKSLSYFEVFGKDNAEIYYSNIVSRIKKYVDRDGKILEIGGGIGELADFMKQKGFTDITVMEPSPRCKKLCNQRGIFVIESDAMQLSQEEKGKYDFIIINHTLEHILCFDKVLENARGMLKDDGHMYIEVPDASEYKNTDFVPYWFFTYEHIFHMGLEGFENLAAAFNYAVTEKKSYLKCKSYYVMYAIFEKSNKESQIVYLPQTKEDIKAYIKMCEAKLEPVINELEKSNEAMVLWGVGTSTAQLLNGNFERCNIKKLIDSNPYRQNVIYHVAGKDMKIEDPKMITEEDGTILILPLMYDASIRKQIKEMKLKNKVKSLIENYKGKDE